MPNTPLPDDLLITVCDYCFRAACWQAESFCSWTIVNLYPIQIGQLPRKSRLAGTTDLPVSKLRRLNREHPDNWEHDPRAVEWRKAHPESAK